ncbi:unnamed protein product [Meganyctiphanes norvegica]|uniref:Growth hormone-regulated TBC protein 1 n=1 Tax=Meganyctiphanes norvegica TaxID=48144 RepID=A0AAV2RH90_MEGNR
MAANATSNGFNTSISKLSNVDEYGFERPEDFDYSSFEEFMSKYLSVLTRRAQKWSHLLGVKETVGRSIKVKRYVRKGIPTKHRGKMWLTISGAKRKMDSQPGYYKSLLENTTVDEIVDLVKLDVPRTFPDNIYFRDYHEGKLNNLYNVLVAFARHNTTIGYCQGLNYIAGMLLIVCKEEEASFWLLVTLVENILPEYYTRDMIGVQIDVRVLEELVRERCPLIGRHMDHHGISWALIVTKWFVCLYAEVLPIETVLRIWDCMFYEGNKVLMRVAITLVQSNQQRLLMAQEFGAIIECFKAILKDAQVLHCHEFMESVYKVSGTFKRADLGKLRDECKLKAIEESKRNR